MMLFRGYKPDWLYEALPYIYIVSGILTASLLRNTSGSISGGLLILAGVVIWKQRRDYRVRNKIPVASAPVISRGADAKVADEEDEVKLVKMVWQPAYDIGHDVIDRQHRRLFVIGNELINAIMAKKPKSDIELMMDELLADITEHFKTESEIMDLHQTPLSEDHQQIHRTLLARITELRDQFHLGKLAVGDLIGFLAYDVVSQHIIKEDLLLVQTPRND